MRIGFIGTGVMGASMARRLMDAGYELDVYNRTKEKAAALIDEGARWRESPGECAADADVVITIVGYPEDVEEVYFGENGIMERAKPGACLIDMTTTSPSISQEIYEAAAERGLTALDAPVSGGDSGAKNGTLSVMVGGDRAVFDAMLPVFECMGRNIVYTGGAGCGQHTKMANQIAIAGAVAGVAEAVAYANAVRLSPQTMLECISAGAAGSWQMSNNGPKMIEDDMAPGFFIKHFIKDLKIAEEEAGDAGLELPALNLVLGMYLTLQRAGLGEEGTQALIKYYDVPEDGE